MGRRRKAALLGIGGLLAAFCILGAGLCVANLLGERCWVRGDVLSFLPDALLAIHPISDYY